MSLVDGYGWWRDRPAGDARARPQVHVERAGEVVVVHVGDGAGERLADVAHDHVEAAQRRDRAVDRGAGALGGDHVGDDRRVARAWQLGGQRGQPVGAARDRAHPRALAGQAQRDRPADAAAGAGDQRPLSGQLEIHGQGSARRDVIGAA